VQRVEGAWRDCRAGPAMSVADGPSGPLANIRVVELSTGLAGGYAAKLFADAGADVVKVEPSEGDSLRRWSASGAPLGGRTGALFEYLAASKRSVVGRPGDQEVREVIGGADLVIEDRTTAAGDRAGLLADPGLVVVSITPFGCVGPWVDRPATEFTVQAESGSLGARGEASRPPVQAGGRIAEWAAGAYGAATGLVAVQHAIRTGEGAHIDVSLTEVMCVCATLFTDLMMSLMGRPPLPQPPRVVEFPSIEPTKDGWVGFNTNAAQMFNDFLVLIGRGDLLGQAMVRMDPARREEFEKSTQAWTLERTTAEVIEEASMFRIPVAPVGNGENLPSQEHLAARGVYVTAPSGGFNQPVPPYRLGGRRLGTSLPAPALGEHTGRIETRRRARAGVPSSGRLPMAGLKVLDMTSWWAGPAATGLFADLGADVIHVESIQVIDGMRPAAAGYFFSREQWWEHSNFFLDINPNKRDITLNLSDPRGLQAAKDLVKWADLVVENFTPRVMENFGLDWPVVHAVNPRAVMARLPAYGLDGPWRDRVGFAQTMEAMSGLAWVTGHADGPPLLPRGPCDPNGAMHAAFAIQVALAQRDATGEGVLVEAPLIESALNIAAEQVIEYSAYGNLLTRNGNRSPGHAPQGVYLCRGEEQWLALSVETDEHWAGLRAALGEPAWASGADLSSHEGRRAAADRLDTELARWAAEQDLPAAVDRLIAQGVPAAPLADFRDMSSHPLLQARGFYELVDHPVVGTHPVVGLPLRYSGIERWVRTPAPTLGQHNAEVLGGILGMSAEQLAELAEAGVIGDQPVRT
jgi:crotonobetainyl-CoA:carnitine CoA-transferase CaiB-like acyl-CoA transferase